MVIGLTLLTIVTIYSGNVKLSIQSQRHLLGWINFTKMVDTNQTNTDVHSSNIYDRNTTAPQHQYSWRVLSKSPYTEVYSAYFDNRIEPQVKILGLKDHIQAEENPVDYYCLVKYGDGREECLNTPAAQTLLNRPDERKSKILWAYTFVCSTDNDESPSHVGLSTHKDCSYALVLPVAIKSQALAKKQAIGVCVQTALYQTSLGRGDVRIETIIEGIERNRAMGAEWMTVYVYRVNRDVLNVLRDYEREVVLEILDWKLSSKVVEDAHYYAESVSIADCLYRNMYRVEYLVFTDLDEIIVPQQHSNWREMMKALHQENIATYQFLHSAILPDSTTQQAHVNWTCHDAQIKPFYLTRTLRTPPYKYPFYNPIKGNIKDRS